MKAESLINYSTLRRHPAINNNGIPETPEQLRQRRSVTRLINLIKMWEKQEMKRIQK